MLSFMKGTFHMSSISTSSQVPLFFLPTHTPSSPYFDFNCQIPDIFQQSSTSTSSGNSSTVADFSSTTTTSSDSTSIVPIRRSSRTITKPSHLTDYKSVYSHHWCNLVTVISLPPQYHAFLSHSLAVTEPASYQEAAQFPHWQAAMDLELQALASYHT